MAIMAATFLILVFTGWRLAMRGIEEQGPVWTWFVGLAVPFLLVVAMELPGREDVGILIGQYHSRLLVAYALALIIGVIEGVQDRREWRRNNPGL